MKLTSMQKMTIAIVAIVALAVLAVVLLIVPRFAELAALDVEAQSAQQSLQQAQALLGQLEQAKARASETQAELLKLGTEVPDSPQLPTLIIEMQDISNASGITLSRIGPQLPVAAAGKGFSEIVLDTTIQGTWADLLDYLRRLNKTTRLLRITDIAITPIVQTTSTSTTATVTQAEQQVTATVKMKAYVIGGQGASGTPPAP
jgi:Tfp pilus assembly protein PilO